MNNEQIIENYLRIIERHPEYAPEFLIVWDALRLPGCDFEKLKRLFMDTATDDHGVAGIISFLGRKIKEEIPVTAEDMCELLQKRSDERKKVREEAAKKPKEFEIPAYGMGSYTCPDTGKTIHWVGYNEKFN
tara:strand:+ start:260 stop:655 length:396 start_codon:yes stop_codon:yes gene_type:complete